MTEDEILKLAYTNKCRLVYQCEKGADLKFAVEVVLSKGGEYDCVLQQSAINTYMRTPKGLTGKRYKHLKALKKECERVLRNHGIVPRVLQVVDIEKDIVLTEQVVK